MLVIYLSLLSSNAVNFLLIFFHLLHFDSLIIFCYTMRPGTLILVSLKYIPNLFPGHLPSGLDYSFV